MPFFTTKYMRICRNDKGFVEGKRPGVTAPFIAARTQAHFEDNLGSCGWALTDDQMTRLTQASGRPLPYPYDIQSIHTQDR
jgi:hypothetical protein